MTITLIILLINRKVAQQITCVLSYRWGSHYTDLSTSKFHTAGSAITQICVLLYCWVSHCTDLCTFIPLSLSQPLHRSVYFHTSESESAIAQVCVLSYCWVSHYDYTDLCTFKFHTGLSHYTDLCTFIPLSQPLYSMHTFILLSQPLHRSVYFHTAESAIMITQICVLSSFILDSAIIQICVLSYLWVSHYTVCILSYCWVSHCTDLCTFILLSQPLWLHRSVYF